jgi:hypothetical protein
MSSLSPLENFDIGIPPAELTQHSTCRTCMFIKCGDRFILYMVTQLDSGVHRVSLFSLSHINRFTLTPNTPPLPLAKSVSYVRQNP